MESLSEGVGRGRNIGGRALVPRQGFVKVGVAVRDFWGGLTRPSGGFSGGSGPAVAVTLSDWFAGCRRRARGDVARACLSFAGAGARPGCRG